LDQLSEYGLPLGEAFQVRDDVLGVFGDPEVTGKPAGDDLREGKRTLLIALSFDNASEQEAEVLARGLGNHDLTPADVDTMREIIVNTGALSRAEAVISHRTEQALEALALAEITEQARDALSQLAFAATRRKV
jgi:geranylgeranyl diphosphate synthase type I